MKDLWCSSIAQLLSTCTDMNGKIYMYSALLQFDYMLSAISMDMNGRVCGTLAQFGCYQHRYKQICKPHSY